MQLYPALHEDNVKKFAIFCCDYFEGLLAPKTFAKNLILLAGVVSKIFMIENSLQPKSQFLHNAFGKSYLLCHFTMKIAHKNLILEIGYTYYANSAFWPKSTFYKIFSKGKQPQNLRLFFWGKLKFPWD